MNIGITGGAGFIGSHFTDRLLSNPEIKKVTLFDNFSSGREWHYQHHSEDSRLQVVRGDVKDLPALTQAMQGHDVVIHLASNPDIAKARTQAVEAIKAEAESKIDDEFATRIGLESLDKLKELLKSNLDQQYLFE